MFLTYALASVILATNFTTGPVNPKSLSKLTFSPDGILFVGDSIGARIFALDLDDRKAPAEIKPFGVRDIEGKIAGMLGTDARDVLIHDLAVNPISKNVYLTVSRGRRGFTMQWQLPNDVANANVLLRVDPTGAISEVKLANVKFSSVDLTAAVDEKKEVDWKKSKMRVDAISDMAFIDGKLYVAGLSNEEFSSTMRVYPYPFNGSATATSLEIYHGAHGKWETDSPIRTFIPYKINGKMHLLASYLCTPLTIFPLDALADKKHIKGTTIAELGFGNYPQDIVPFSSGGKDYLFIVNSTRGMMMVKAENLQKPLTAITSQAGPGTGLEVEHLRGQGVIHAKNYSDKLILRLTRDTLTGDLNLATWDPTR
jgi:hypothetical protein